MASNVASNVFTVVTQAIAIFVAWHFSKFFRVIALCVLFDDDMQTNPWSLLAADSIWFALLLAISPYAYNFLRKRGGSKKLNDTQSKSQTLCEDVYNFWGIAIVIINMWAYKDVALRAMNVVEGAPTSFFSKTTQEAEDNLTYCMKMVGVGIGVTGFATALHTCLHLYLKDQETRTKEEGGGGGHYSRVTLNSCPMALGIGIVWYRVCTLPMYIIPGGGMTDKYPKVFTGCAMLMTNLMIVTGVVHTMRTFVTSAEESESETNVLKMTTKQFLHQEFKRLFVKSMPFVFSWGMSNLGYFLVFTIGWDCEPLSAKCTGRIQLQFIVQLYYAIGLTFVAIKAVPALKEEQQMMRRLNPNCIKVFMDQDKDFVLRENIKSQLIVTGFAITIGWAWTEIAATECEGGFSFTCPSDQTFGSFLVYFLMVMVYFFLAVALYHSMMETQRLANRCRKVISIEDGNGARLFSDIMKDDVDGDGLLDKQELEAFIEAEGLNAEPFLQAAAICDKKDGIITGDVEMDELMEECNKLLVKIKDGTYIAGEHTMHFRKEVGGISPEETNDMQIITMQSNDIKLQVLPDVNDGAAMDGDAVEMQDLAPVVPTEAEPTVGGSPASPTQWRKKLAERVAMKNLAPMWSAKQGGGGTGSPGGNGAAGVPNV